MRRLLACAAFGLLPLLSGCGAAESEVSGTVLMDGQPLAEGEIIFEDPAKATTPAAEKIVNGKYSLKVLPGPKKVKILSSRLTGRPDPVMGMSAREQAIGPEYNEQTKLTADIKAGTQTGVDFEVKQLPKKK